MKKKLLSVLLVLAMALALVSCGKKKENDPGSQGATNTPTPATNVPPATDAPPATNISGDLLVWLDNDEWADAVIEAFNKKYPDVKVEYQNVGNVDSRGKVSLDGPAGIGPDIFMMPHDHISLAVNDGLCEPMTATLSTKFKNEILEAALETCTSDGKIYAVPIFIENIALFYNKDLYGDKAPTTFEEIIDFAKGYNDFAAGKYTLAWQVDDAYHNYFWLTAFGMKIFGPNMDDYKNPGFDSAEAKAGVDYYRSLRKQLFDVNVADASWDATVSAFQRGEVPLTISGPWAIADAVSNGVNFGITKIPTIDGKQPRCFAGVILAAVSSYTENPDAAFAFVEFLASDEAASIHYKITGKMTALKNTNIEGLKDDAYLKGISEQSPYADPMPIIPEVNQMWDALKALFTFTWDDTLSTADAQKKAMETYETALQAAGKTMY